jgi:hypothetical protein
MLALSLFIIPQIEHEESALLRKFNELLENEVIPLLTYVIALLTENIRKNYNLNTIVFLL